MLLNITALTHHIERAAGFPCLFFNKRARSWHSFSLTTCVNQIVSLKKLIMKKLLPILSILFFSVLLFTACTNKTTDPAAKAGSVLTYVDTTGLADFQKWKTQNELKDPDVYYQQGIEEQPASIVRTATPKTPVRKSVGKTTSMNSVSQYPAKTVAKKGWSRKAKGAVIGGGGGAIIGALLGKRNRLVGGALGGALGAGVGYVIGNELDRKHGR